MDRETKVIETPVGKNKVELKTYLTGREKKGITAVFLNDVSVETASSNNPVFKGLKGDLVLKAEEVALATVVVSVDGSSENVADKVLDMRLADYNYVIAEVNKITADADFEQKKTS